MTTYYSPGESFAVEGCEGLRCYKPHELKPSKGYFHVPARSMAPVSIGDGKVLKKRASGDLECNWNRREFFNVHSVVARARSGIKVDPRFAECLARHGQRL